MPEVVRHERFISVDIAYTAASTNGNLKGSNKCWQGTVFDNGDFLAEFGKVGGTLTPDRKACGSVDAANAYMDRKIAEKMKGKVDSKTGMRTKYERVNVVETKEGDRPRSVSASSTDLAQLARDQIAQGDPIVAELVARLARENTHNILTATGGKISFDDTTGLFSTPMGVVTQETIDEARAILSAVADLVPKKRFTDTAYIDGVQQYMTKIPMSLGYGRVTPDMIFPTMDKVSEQGDILDSLEASLKLVSDRALAAATGDDAPVVVEPPKVFNVKLTLLEAAKDLAKFRKMYRDTRKDAHVCAHLDVKRVFTVDIKTMREAFEEKGKPIGNSRTAWHGSRTSNLLSILRGGLVIPPANAAHCTGRLFGPGVYVAPSSTKSLNYAYGYWGGRGGYSENCFMFLVDIAMGNAYTPRGTSGTLPVGYHSIWAKSGISGVYNDEIILPHTYQCNLTYLLEFSPGGK